MARRFDPLRRQRQGWPHRNRLEDLRRRMFRASDGRLLGVFKGIADSQGYNVCRTRVVGVIALLALAGAFGAHGLKVTLLVAGFFYLLTALLMQPPLRPDQTATTVAPGRGYMPPSMPMPTPVSVPGSQARYPRPRVDLGQLDRQLDGLNRRIQRMETIVTDREYEWNRRMRS